MVVLERTARLTPLAVFLCLQPKERTMDKPSNDKPQIVTFRPRAERVRRCACGTPVIPGELTCYSCAA
jgi:hypothetical protein